MMCNSLPSGDCLENKQQPKNQNGDSIWKWIPSPTLQINLCLNICCHFFINFLE